MYMYVYMCIVQYLVVYMYMYVRAHIHVFVAQDGRLKPGDQILEVDGNDLLGCTQERLVMSLLHHVYMFNQSAHNDRTWATKLKHLSPSPSLPSSLPPSSPSLSHRATQVLRNTGKKVTLLVGKLAAQYYGLSHIIQQSSPLYNRNSESHDACTCIYVYSMCMHGTCMHMHVHVHDQQQQWLRKISSYILQIYKNLHSCVSYAHKLMKAESDK